MAFIWGNVVYLSDYIDRAKGLSGTYIDIKFEQMFPPWCEMNFGFYAWRHKLLHIFVIYFRKFSLHFSISNDISNFTSSWVKPSTVTIRTTYNFERNDCNKILCSWFNSLTQRQPLRINFLIKSVTLGSSGSAIPAALPELW